MDSFGPYDSEAQTRREPLATEIRALHESGQLRSGDPDRLVDAVQKKHLLDFCEQAGIDLGVYDVRVLAWLAGRDPSAVQVVLGLISRAYEAGRKADTVAGAAP
ncbi:MULTISPECIES: hypothetical protein [Nonomuraea]|uniref:Uncharacterized protein n=2 Tax=Nonomuraea TaxID=83681 RepID=A0A7W5V1P3_9ACTN|nr:hypothetical protein [Nonomuraea dietziae]MBB3724204.1 hypothetical protein [Nonomuraea dietziae]